MNNYNLGKNLLVFGCFLLPTSGYIGPFLILLSCILGSFLQGSKALFTKKMYPLYFLSLLILVSAFSSPFGLQSCGGIFNWLPFFWLFWSLSIYLKEKNNIKRVAMSLVFGTIPVLIVGFTQLILGFNGSYRILGSFIVWHVLDTDQFTGIFYNRNICAAWLAAVFPFFIAVTCFNVRSREVAYKKIVSLSALFSISFAMIMSASRNAVGSIFFGFVGMFADSFSSKHVIENLKLPRLLIVLLAIPTIFSLSAHSGLELPSLDYFRQIFANDDRLEIWGFGLHIASKNFLVGSGSGGFTNYVSLLSPFDRVVNHVHSLPLDLWVSYGFLAMISFVAYVFTWLFMAIRSDIFRNCLFTKAWMISFVLLIIFHFTDLPYLDARINLVGWILFTGLVSCTESSGLKSAE